MRLLIFVLCSLLLASCVAHEEHHPTPAEQRFNATWDEAEPWETALARFREAAPDSTDPLLPVLFKGREQDFPPMQVGALRVEGDLDSWRGEQVLGRNFRRSANVGSRDELEVLLKAALPASENAHLYWSGAPGRTLVDADGNDVLMNPPALENVREVRLVFRLLRDPVPLELYQHGADIDVARWGYGVETVSVELAGEEGRALAHLFVQPVK